MTKEENNRKIFHLTVDLMFAEIEEKDPTCVDPSSPRTSAELRDEIKKLGADPDKELEIGRKLLEQLHNKRNLK